MNRQLRTLAFAVAAVAAASFSTAFARTVGQNPEPGYVNINGSNPGLLVAGKASVKISDIPAAAQQFIARHFKYAQVVEVEKSYPSRNVEVALRDGTDLEFTADGVWVEIDAPDGATLPQSLLKEVLPSKAYSEIERRGYIQLVNSVEREGKNHFKVEVNMVKNNEFIFDLGGYLIRIDD